MIKRNIGFPNALDQFKNLHSYQFSQRFWQQNTQSKTFEKHSKSKNKMESRARDVPKRTRRTSVASDAVTAIMLLSVYQQSQSPLCFPGAQASDLTVIQHSNAIINMYNNGGCIHNIGCHERSIGHFIVSSFFCI